MKDEVTWSQDCQIFSPWGAVWPNVETYPQQVVNFTSLSPELSTLYYHGFSGAPLRSSWSSNKYYSIHSNWLMFVHPCWLLNILSIICTSGQSKPGEKRGYGQDTENLWSQWGAQWTQVSHCHGSDPAARSDHGFSQPQNSAVDSAGHYMTIPSRDISMETSEVLRPSGVDCHPSHPALRTWPPYCQTPSWLGGEKLWKPELHPKETE